jgi:hypothetical protein
LGDLERAGRARDLKIGARRAQVGNREGENGGEGRGGEEFHGWFSFFRWR